MTAFFIAAALALTTQAQAACEAQAERAYDRAVLLGDSTPDARWEDAIAMCDLTEDEYQAKSAVR